MTQTIHGQVPSKSNCYVSNEILIDSYNRLGSVWKTAKEVGLCGQSVHERLTKLNKINKLNYWTEEDDKVLIKEYLLYKQSFRLEYLAAKLNRTKNFICRKARTLGLTGTKTVVPDDFKKRLSVSTKKRLLENGHPKGMLGKNHSEKFKSDMSKRVKLNWMDSSSKLNSQELKQKQSDNMSALQASGKLRNNYSRAKSGTFEIGGKTYFYRSEWEVNIANYLEFLKSNGEIKDWLYESDVFWFDKIKRGVRSYKPDFKIINKDDSFYFIEVKGWMDDKSKTKLNRMRIYYPQIKIELLDVKRYNSIKKMANVIPNWGMMGLNKQVEFIKCTLEGCENKTHSKGLCRKHYYKLYKK